jgi:hypothetical protein
MPASDMKVESEYMIPEETPVPVRLNAVEVKEFQSKDRDTKALQFDKDGNPVMYKKWNWEFQVCDGPYTGVRLSKLTAPYISTRDDNLVRIYAETLTGKTWGESEGIDTDDLVGLKAVALVKHQPPRPKKNGDGNWYGLDLADLFPADALGDSEPPF